MIGKVNIRLNGEMSFEANVDSHKIMIDTAEEFGGANKGPRPKSLMMVSIAGCTGMDVAAILRKMKIDFQDLQVEVLGNITETHPKHFDSMHLIYKLKGKNIPEEKVKKAVELSQNNYCGVSFSYRKAMEITYEIRIN